MAGGPAFHWKLRESRADAHPGAHLAHQETPPCHALKEGMFLLL